MISTEIYIEDYRLDLVQDISTEFTYTIDDITDFGSKNTNYSKTISITGTATNNKIFGFIFDLGNANETDDTLPNVNYNFNASKQANCKIFIDKIQIFKGTLRILEIVIDDKTIEYQCSVFGELGGFITELGNKRLQDLDFSAYNHAYNIGNIKSSWEVSGSRGTNNSTDYGSGYFYPLIDYGNVSTDKVNFQVTAYRPALFVKEYIEKIFEGTDYTYTLDLLEGDQELFNRLIIPNNQKGLTKVSAFGFSAVSFTGISRNTSNPTYISFPTQSVLGSFVSSLSNTQFTYTSVTPLTGDLTFNIKGTYSPSFPTIAIGFYVYKNGVVIGSHTQPGSNTILDVNIVLDNVSFNLNDTLRVAWFASRAFGSSEINVSSGSLNITSLSSLIPINYGETIEINTTLPKGIFQRDFFLSITKMFNLYVYEDTWDDKKIMIKPFINFYPETSATALDWSNKIDRAKPLSIKPMSELNARYFHYKFKQDNDFYNENYFKKYNESYGDRIYDTDYDFSKETESLSVIFAPSVLYQKTGTDKIYPAIYKVSDNNTKENSMDSVIRIMQAAKITGRTSHNILNGVTVVDTITIYGYGGHLDNPFTPTNDINFGVPFEIQFSASTYPSTNVFNAYHSEYIAEITSKDSKLLTCSALLDTVDIMNLDFSKFYWIDGILFRLNKVDGFNPMEYKTTKISLLKVIETKYFL
jgi:hypothetical protein